MKKILFVATVDNHILSFHLPFLEWFKEQGYEIHVASNGNGDIPFVDIKHNVMFERIPFRTTNYKSYKKLKNIINDNNYSLIHCHTPVGGVIGRLASRHARKKGTSVIYTAHGFHFYKGSSLISWLIYYPIEKLLSKYTDCIITINEEDYQSAVGNKFKTNYIKMVHGVGVDLTRFSGWSSEEKRELRKRYEYNQNDFILFYAAELNKNKHQDLLIRAVQILKEKIPNIKLLLAGKGDLSEEYKDLARSLNVDGNIDFLGYRKDIPGLLAISDISVSASRREGLPVNVMEAMATGLPLVVTNCRGNRDLVQDGMNGFIKDVDDVEEFASSIMSLYNSVELRKQFGEKSIELAQKYSLENVLMQMKEMYSKQLGGE